MTLGVVADESVAGSGSEAYTRKSNRYVTDESIREAGP
jgi:hypothetical protein